MSNLVILSLKLAICYAYIQFLSSGHVIFFFIIKGEEGGRGRPYVIYLSGRDLIGALPASECWIKP